MSANPMARDLRLTGKVKLETIASGEIYPAECVISQSSRQTRSVADKRSFESAGNAMYSTGEIADVGKIHLRAHRGERELHGRNL